MKDVTSVQPPGGSASGWQRLASPPLSSRAYATGVWTGDEVLVIGGDPEAWCPSGGDCAGPDQPALADGAAFDLGAGTWRRIAVAPVPMVEADSAVVDGQVYVWVRDAGRPGGRPAFLRYDPARDVWSELPLPIDDPSWYRIEAVPDGVVAYRSSDEVGGDLPDLIFDPGAGTWRALPPDPLSPSYDRTMVGTGAGLVLFDHELVRSPGSERPSVTRAAILDLASESWERLPDSEILATGPWHVERDLLVLPALGGADGGGVGNWGRTYPNGGAFDLATRQWAALADPPGDHDPTTGGGVGVFGGHSALYWGYHGVVLDLAAQRWIEIPALDEPEGTSARTVVAAGRSLFVFGGQVWPRDAPAGHTTADAWMWTPPN